MISKERTNFEPNRNVTRAEAYSLIMKSVCMNPENSTAKTAWQKSVFERASLEGLTSKTWTTFDPERPILRQELFKLATKVADWAERTG